MGDASSENHSSRSLLHDDYDNNYNIYMIIFCSAISNVNDGDGGDSECRQKDIGW